MISSKEATVCHHGDGPASLALPLPCDLLHEAARAALEQSCFRDDLEPAGGCLGELQFAGLPEQDQMIANGNQRTVDDAALLPDDRAGGELHFH